jgi:hypothetical protein
MTPSSEMFSLTTIFPMAVLLLSVLSATTGLDAATLAKGALPDRPLLPPAGVRTGGSDSGAAERWQ